MLFTLFMRNNSMPYCNNDIYLYILSKNISEKIYKEKDVNYETF